MYEYKGIVKNVVDGDTFDIELDLGFYVKVLTRFRVKDYDAPETRHIKGTVDLKPGLSAKEFAAQLLLNKEVIVRSYKTDSFGRWLCDIILPDGRDFKQVMIENGFVKQNQN